MFVVSRLEIVQKLTRKEIIEIGASLNCLRVQRFLSQFRLNEEEIKKFQMVYQNDQNVLDVISYYQEGNLDAFRRRI